MRRGAEEAALPGGCDEAGNTLVSSSPFAIARSPVRYTWVLHLSIHGQIAKVNLSVDSPPEREDHQVMVLAVTDASFEARVLRADKPVLVKFWAEWCGPCRQLSPTVWTLAVEFAPRLVVVGVEIDECPETAKAFGIRGTPTLILFRDGAPVARKVGALPYDGLSRWLEAELG